MQPTIEERSNQAQSLVVRAKELRILTREDYEDAALLGRSLRALQEEIEAYWNGTDQEPGPVAKAYATWKDLTAKRKAMLDPIALCIARLSAAIVAYDAAEQRKADEAQRMLEEQERQRRQVEIDAALAEAKADGATARELRAIRKIEEAQPINVPIVNPAPRPTGLSVPKTWDAECTDLMSLIKAIVAGKAALTFVQFNDVAARKFAGATKGTVVIPGVKFFEKPGVRFGKEKP